MKRMGRSPKGRGNVMLEDAPMPEPGYGEVRVKSVRSLISRGSEIGRRYVMEEAIDPQMRGYSMAGTVDALGEGVEHLAIGDRVGAVAPHAQYVLGAALPEQQGKDTRDISAHARRQLGPGALLDAGRIGGALGGHCAVRARQRHRHPGSGPGRQPHAPGHARDRSWTARRGRRRAAAL